MSLKHDAATEKEPAPLTIVTWNCNGFTSRCRWDAKGLEKLLQDTSHPDIVCMQEVRLKAINPDQRGVPLPKEMTTWIQEVMNTTFGGYAPFWSLASKKYAGTLTLVRKPLCTDLRTAFTRKAAIDLLLEKFSLSREKVGLSRPSPSTSGTGAGPSSSSQASSPSPSKKRKVQTTMSSFFASKPSSSETTGQEENTNNASSTQPPTRQNFLVRTIPAHHPEGRFQFLSFPNMDIIQTYVPNNGSDDASFTRRSEWDADMLQFLKDRQQILKVSGKSMRPLLWCGDLNCAATYLDGSHWKQKAEEEADGCTSFYEWWADETKCWADKAPSRNEIEMKLPENRGMPGFTPGERQRFHDLLKTGDFVDVWRSSHPNGADQLLKTDDASSGISTNEDKHSSDSIKNNQWELPNYTWRGSLGVSGNVAKYEGRGQRIDYFLLSPADRMSDVRSCEITGFGRTRVNFCGSDHCPSVLKLTTALV